MWTKDNVFWACVWVLMVVGLGVLSAAASLNPEGFARGLVGGLVCGIAFSLLGAAAYVWHLALSWLFDRG